ncbi:MAG TPA: hypothetical protein IGS52_03575 [Oscillatoriaceae cyanobacterium M33_DOE_052]|uniref:Uncharacterized protein n=1 Tax=Planktothricoides sp. SpSt-374 TaxID=2282167 RepID=A0A7C3ZQ39_9CYAN|nr:hypothetical protein [Oscillatoriaceae cyanobacterium M33_DOE_052]
MVQELASEKPGGFTEVIGFPREIILRNLVSTPRLRVPSSPVEKSYCPRPPRFLAKPMAIV